MAAQSSFHDDWHQVADLQPHLKPTVSFHRQIWREKIRYVVYDAFSDEHFFINESSHFFILNLNGQRSVDEIWFLSNQRFGDESLTQGEVVEILQQLFSHDLLKVDQELHTVDFFQDQRRQKEKGHFSFVKNILFARVPLGSPEACVKFFFPFLRVLFTGFGFTAFLLLLGTACYQLVSSHALIRSDLGTLLEVKNLIALYAVTVCLKLFHELGHGTACKHFLKQAAQDTPIQKCGILFLLFIPFPFIDVSPSWKLKNKFHRMIIALSGMYFELLLAAVSALIYVNTSQNQLIHSLAFNAMISSSISSLLFNANPFLRYDAYYVLSDYLELANLMENSRRFCMAKFKRLFFGVESILPDYSASEKTIFAVYGSLSFLVRTLILLSIVSIVGEFVAGASIHLVFLVILLYVVPIIFRFLSYLNTSKELNGRRFRAMAISSLLFGLMALAVATVKLPYFNVLEAHVATANKQLVISKYGGSLKSHLDDGAYVRQGELVAQIDHREMKLEIAALKTKVKSTALRRDLAFAAKDFHQAQIYDFNIAIAKEKIATLKDRINELKIYAQFDGYFLAPGLSAKRHSELPQNESLGEVIDASSIRIKSYFDQRNISQYFTYQPESVLIRFPGKGEEEYQGKIIKLAPSALKREGGFNSERYFELEIQAEEGFTSLPGQGVEVKLQYQDQTCWQILKREVSLVFQRKFKL